GLRRRYGAHRCRDRAQPLVPRGFPGFLASGVLLVWNPSRRKAPMSQVALWSVAPAMAESGRREGGCARLHGLPEGVLAATGIDELPGAIEQRNQTPFARGGYLPEQRCHSAVGGSAP